MKTYEDGMTRSEMIQNLLNRHKSGWSLGCPSGLHGNIGRCSCGIPIPGFTAKLMALLPWQLTKRLLRYGPI